MNSTSVAIWRRTTLNAVAGVALAAACLPAIAQTTINLTAIDGYPPRALWIKEFINFYIPEVDKRLAKDNKYRIRWNQAWGGQIVKPQGVLEGPDRALPADDKGRDHVREDHHVAQGHGRQEGVIARDEGRFRHVSARSLPGYRNSAGLFEQHQRLNAVVDDLLGDHQLVDVAARRDGVHHVEHHLFHDDAQAAGADPALDRLLGDRTQSLLLEAQLDVLELEHRLVLLHQAVLGLLEDAHQRRLVELLEGRDHRQAARGDGGRDDVSKRR